MNRLPQAGIESTCPTCRESVLAVPYHLFSSPVLLDGHELPITADLAQLAPNGLAWRYLGPRLGWDPLHVAARDWRPLRHIHQCAESNITENKFKEKT